MVVWDFWTINGYTVTIHVFCCSSMFQGWSSARSIWQIWHATSSDGVKCGNARRDARDCTWADDLGKLVTSGFTLLGTNISPEKSILKMIFLFPRWDMLISWRVIPRSVTKDQKHTDMKLRFNSLQGRMCSTNGGFKRVVHTLWSTQWSRK